MTHLMIAQVFPWFKQSHANCSRSIWIWWDQRRPSQSFWGKTSMQLISLVSSLVLVAFLFLYCLLIFLRFCMEMLDFVLPICQKKRLKGRNLSSPRCWQFFVLFFFGWIPWRPKETLNNIHFYQFACLQALEIWLILSPFMVSSLHVEQ